MKKFNFAIAAAVAVVCLMASAPAVQAAVEVDTLEYFLTTLPLLVPNTASLKLSQEFRYNDNIDDRPRSHASGSFISNTRLDGSLTRATDQVTWGIGASVGYEHYFHRPKSTHRKDFSYSLTPILNGKFDFAGGELMLKLTSKMSNVEMDQSDNEVVMRAENGGAAAWDVELGGHSGLTITADVMDVRYAGKEYAANEYDRYGGSIAPYYKVSDRQRVGLDTSWRRTEYRNNDKHDDYNAVEIKAFDNYVLNARTSLYLGLGAKNNYYESGSPSDKNSDDRWGLTALASLRYLLTESMSTTIRVGRDVVDSQTGNARGRRVDLFTGIALDWRLTGKLVFRQGLTAYLSDEKTSNDDLTRYLYNARFEYEARENLGFYVGYNLNCKRYKYMDEKNYYANEFIVGATYSFK